MARKPRTRRVEAAGKHPRQTMAGYYPTTYKPITSKAAQVKKGATAREVLAALENEPMKGSNKQRVFFYGARTDDDHGKSAFKKGQTDVKGHAIRRESIEARMREIDADVQSKRAELEMAAIQNYGPSPPTQIASMLRRTINRQVRAYEEGLMAEYASKQMGRGYEYSKILGVWVAS